MEGKRHLLVMRFSSMGDVAMTVPVVKALLDQNPQLTVTYISRPAFAEFFADIPRLTFFAVDVRDTYNGFLGLLKLKRHLNKYGK